jgi:hypothetical protein
MSELTQNIAIILHSIKYPLYYLHNIKSLLADIILNLSRENIPSFFADSAKTIIIDHLHGGRHGRLQFLGYGDPGLPAVLG